MSARSKFVSPLALVYSKVMTMTKQGTAEAT